MTGVRRDGQDTTGYMGINPEVTPKIIKAQRAPLTTDRRQKIGTIWINQATDISYQLTNVTAGSATWTLLGPGSSDVDTLTSTITFNLDAAITLATSVTSPIYTAAAGLAINAAAANDITIKMGDAVAGNKVSFVDSAAAEVASIDSDGTLTVVNMDGIIGATTPAAITGTTITANTSFVSDVYTAPAASDLNINSIAGQDVIVKLGDAAGANKLSVTTSAGAEVFAIDSTGGITYASITSTGLITGQAGLTIETAGTPISLGEDNSGDAVVVGGGTVARAITIGQDAAAHTVAIGQAAAGAITVDTAAGISLDSVTASNFTVTGAADLTLNSTAGSVIVNGEEAVADAIQIQTAAGGVDWNTALQSNIDSSQAAADAIRIVASNAAGGIDIDAGTGGIAIDTTGALAFSGDAASTIAVAGAGIDLTLESAAGRVILNGEEAADNAITLLSAAGGLDVNTALQINVDSSQAAADAIRIVASNAAGGIDIDAGTGGIAIDTTGALALSGDAASTIAVAGAGIDLTLSSAAGRVVVNGEEAAANAVTLLSAAGGIDADAALQINIASSQAAADAVNIVASDAAGGVQIDAGTTGLTINTGQVVNVVNKVAGDSPYTVLGTDYVIACDTGAGAITVTLPAAPETGRIFIVCDEGGAAGATNITIDGNGNNISAGGTVAGTKAIDSNYGSMMVIYTGTVWTGLDVA